MLNSKNSKLYRKMRKLKKNPKVFIEDSLKKRKSQISKLIPQKKESENSFTIISAVYNVEKYLNDYFESLINQTIEFESSIQLILVDDGSTDNSAYIIKKWQEKYPKNIIYLHKENGGQASARNLGLSHAKFNWITFIDPDDFISLSYFELINNKIVSNTSINMLVTNLVFYNEGQVNIKDSHPLRFRFKNEAPIPASELDNNINLSASATIFKLDDIKNNDLRFNSSIKPNFEDGKFIADYLLNINEGKVLFVEESVYFYRKREDGTSTLDTSWSKKERYYDVFVHGFIPMLKMYKEQLGFIPKNIQKTALYDMSWYVQYLINSPERLGFLDENQRQEFYQLFLKVFEYIDESTILSFNMAGVWFFQKVGMMGAFKNKNTPFKIAYITDIDKEKKQILVNTFMHNEGVLSFRINKKDVIPTYHKTIIHSFNDRPFVYESRSWISYDSYNDKFDAFIDTQRPSLSLKNRHFKNGIDIRSVKEAFTPSKKYISDGSWLLMDRETKADDNAEHLYRYLRDKHPERVYYFALRSDSGDWTRLKQDGFNLVDFGTESFELHLRKSSKIISSHLEKHINDYFGDQYEYSKQFIFLQHGVTKDDLSSWINSKKNIQLLITTTFPEYNSFVDKDSSYKLTEKEVVLTGFPRHDSLLVSNSRDSKIILIMPTWRNNIVGQITGIGSNTRTINKYFMQTNYAKHWHSLVHSKELRNLVEIYNYQVIFAPHANIEPYVSMFELPSYIDVWQSSTAEMSMQQLFQQSKLMITDYSSVAFEMGLLSKTTLYYQFDKDEVFSGSHTYQKGYFDYEKDGFGPVVTTEEELLKNLEVVLKNNGEPLEPYATRIQDTFAYRDTNNCERVYQAIVALDEPETKELDLDILYDMTVSANDNEVWDLAESRSLLLIEYCDEAQIGEAQEVLNKALFNQNKFTELFAALESDNSSQDEINYWKAKVAYATTNWQEVIKLLSSMTALDEELKFMLLFSYAKTGKVAEFEKLKKEVQEGQLNEAQYLIIQAWSLRLCKQWQAIIDLLKNELSKFDLEQLTEYQPETLMAQAYRHLSDFEQAHQQLANFERHTKNNPRCRIEIARLAYSRDNYDKCIAQYNATVNGDIGILPQTAIQKYILSLWGMGNFDSLMELLPEMISMYPHNDEFRLTYVRVLAERSQWQELLEQASTLIQESKEKLVYPLTLARYRLGLIDEAYENAVKPTIEHSYEYWRLVAEIALLLEDTDLAKYCYKGMIAIYPAYDSSYNWSRFDSLKG